MILFILSLINVQERIIDLVEKTWIIKERPQNDERTVIIHFNEDLKDQRESLLNFFKEEIDGKSTSIQNSLKSIINL